MELLMEWKEEFKSDLAKFKSDLDNYYHKYEERY